MEGAIDEKELMEDVYMVFSIADAIERGGKLYEDPVRSPLTRQTLKGHAKRGRNILVVYDDGRVSPKTMDLMDRLEKDGGLVKMAQEQPGVGGAQREAIHYAVCEYGAWAVLKSEPEKTDFVELCPLLIPHLLDENTIVVVPNRTEYSWCTFYPFQIKTEVRGNDLVSEIREDTFGKPLDEYFGPKVYRKEAEPYIWAYDDEKWAMHMAPNDDMIKAGYEVKGVDVDYVHPKAQAGAEMNDPKFLEKRAYQLVQNTNAILQHHCEVYPEHYAESPPEIRTMDGLKKYFSDFDWSGFDLFG